jgi:hypothetical protein
MYLAANPTTKEQKLILHYFKPNDNMGSFGTDVQVGSSGISTTIHCSFQQLSLYKRTSLDFQREWEVNFSKLCVFKKKHGHCNVPTKSSPLGRWVSIQRELKKCKDADLPSNYENPPITDGQIRRLHQLGFTWSLRNRQSWADMYEQLLHYKMKHGTCNVPQKYSHNKPLGRWVGKQRENMKKGILHPSREHALKQAGFFW